MSAYFAKTLAILTDPNRDEMVLRNAREREIALEFDGIHVIEREGVFFAVGTNVALFTLVDAILDGEPSDAECRAAEARFGA